MNDEFDYVETRPEPETFWHQERSRIAGLAISCAWICAALSFLGVVVASLHERWL